jgi:hypothetical protein
MRKNTVVYKLIVEDLQNVAEEYLERKLNGDELKKVINRVGDYISWDEAIENTIIDLGLKSKEEQEDELNQKILETISSKPEKSRK